MVHLNRRATSRLYHTHTHLDWPPPVGQKHDILRLSRKIASGFFHNGPPNCYLILNNAGNPQVFQLLISFLSIISSPPRQARRFHSSRGIGLKLRSEPADQRRDELQCSDAVMAAVRLEGDRDA